MKFMKSLEKSWKRFKTSFFKPILYLLAKTGITPNQVSLAALAFAVATFYFALKGEIGYAAVFFIIHIVLDLFDGTLARYTKQASDKGKFLDMIVDNIAATLLVLALAIIGVINPINGAVFIYLMIMVIIFAAIINSKYYKSKWLFHARAGIVAHLPKNLFYICTLFWALNIIDIVN